MLLSFFRPIGPIWMPQKLYFAYMRLEMHTMKHHEGKSRLMCVHFLLIKCNVYILHSFEDVFIKFGYPYIENLI